MLSHSHSPHRFRLLLFSVTALSLGFGLLPQAAAGLSVDRVPRQVRAGGLRSSGGGSRQLSAHGPEIVFPEGGNSRHASAVAVLEWEAFSPPSRRSTAVAAPPALPLLPSGPPLFSSGLDPPLA